MELRYKEHDGGRKDAGFKGATGDCVTRAIAIATGSPYRRIYKELGDLYSIMTGGLERSPRNGVAMPVTHRYLIDRGWELWHTPNAYFTSQLIPMEGTVIAVLPRHKACVIDGVVFDGWDSRKSNRTKSGAPKLLGFYSLPSR